MIEIFYPLGAGGNWLRSTIESVTLEDKFYVNFHNLSSQDSWIQTKHLSKYCQDGLIFSGTYYFNFFINHIYKFYHHEQNLFHNTEYENYWMTIVAAAYEICQADNYSYQINFNFDQLIDDPNKFYSSVIDLQKNYNKPVMEYEDFLLRRQKYIDSCVNVDNMIENFDNMIWVAFVLGQLMTYNIHPEFSIAELDNQLLCRNFARENYHRCHLKNFFNPNSKVYLPNFKN